MSQEITRRKFIKGTILGGAGLALGNILTSGCQPVLPEAAPSPVAPPPSKSPPPESGAVVPAVYKRSLESIKGLPFLEQKELGEVLQVLETEPHPMMPKIAHNIRSLLVAQEPTAAGLPEWLDKDTLPLAIVYQDSKTSNLHNTGTFPTVGEPERFIYTDQNTSTAYDMFDKMIFGIQLGIAPEVKKAGPLITGYLLAKEYLTFLTFIALSEEYYHYLTTLPNIKITDTKGQPINDKKRQLAIGYTSLWMAQNHEHNIWKTMDGFPMLLLAPAALRSVQGNKDKADKLAMIRGIYLANNLLYEKHTAYQKGTTRVDYTKGTADIVEDYTKGKGLLLPKQVGLTICDENYIQLIIQLQDQIKKDQPK